MATVLFAAIEGNLGYVLGKELEDDGHRVDRMPPDTELTAHIADHPVYDVVLIDLLTSSLTDLESLRSIKKTFPHAHLIVFSDRIAPQDRPALLLSGADRCFMKHEINDLKRYLLQRSGPAGAS